MHFFKSSFFGLFCVALRMKMYKLSDTFFYTCITPCYTKLKSKCLGADAFSTVEFQLLLLRAPVTATANHLAPECSHQPNGSRASTRCLSGDSHPNAYCHNSPFIIIDRKLAWSVGKSTACALHCTLLQLGHFACFPKKTYSRLSSFHKNRIAFASAELYVFSLCACYTI